MRKVINLTQHAPTPEQIEAGVVPNSPEIQKTVSALLTFETLPSRDQIWSQAKDLAILARGIAESMEANFKGPVPVMIGGAPYLMMTLENQLSLRGMEAVFAFSARESVETHNADGSVSKTMVFRHKGFVE